MLLQIQWMVLSVFNTRHAIVFDDCVIVDSKMLHNDIEDALSVFGAFEQSLDVVLGWGMVSLVILRHISQNPGCTKAQCIDAVIRASHGKDYDPYAYQRAYYYGKFNSLVDCYYMIGKKLYLTCEGYEEINRLESYCSVYKQRSTSTKVDLANEVNNGRE